MLSNYRADHAGSAHNQELFISKEFHDSIV